MNDGPPVANVRARIKAKHSHFFPCLYVASIFSHINQTNQCAMAAASACEIKTNFSCKYKIDRLWLIFITKRGYMRLRINANRSRGSALVLERASVKSAVWVEKAINLWAHKSPLDHKNI